MVSAPNVYGKVQRECGRFWILTQLVCPTLASVAFSGIRWVIAIGNRFDLRLSDRLIHDRMSSTFVDSVVSTETETEVESTSAISSEVQSHSQDLEEELVWPENSCGGA